MSWLLSPSSAAKMIPKLSRKASTVLRLGPEEDGGESRRSR
jgi:hypothetical protein